MFRKLKGKIIEIFGSQSSFAKALGQSETWVSTKLNGKSAFTKKDMENWGQLLQIPTSEYYDYFFYSTSCENATNQEGT